MEVQLHSRIILAIFSLSLAYGLLVVFVHVRGSVVPSRSEALYVEFLKLQRDYEGRYRSLAQAVRRFSHCECGMRACELRLHQRRCVGILPMVPINPTRPRSHAFFTANAQN